MAAIPQRRSPTIDAIYRVYEQRESENASERGYLGISVLGEECERKLFYGFRWVSEPEQFEGRMLRLFETGHREEERVIRDLQAAGIDIREIDPATGEQWAVQAAGGHVRGHMDGVVFAGVIEAPKARHVFECKTHNDKSFKELITKGVQIAKPMHYAQMQGYMHLKGIDRALYIAVEKSTDQIHIERIHYDPIYAGQLMAKGERIVTANRPPAKLHEDPNSRAAFACGWCPKYGACHGGEWPRVNCRTCLHSAPLLDGDARWVCNRHGNELSRDEQKAGCPNHLFIPDLVPGKQIDADPDAETVTYLLPSGKEWTDGAGKAVTG
jgi:hypothetical protein